MNYFIDFEFTSSAELNVDPVCVVILDENGIEERHWLFRCPDEKRKFADRMRRLEGNTLIAYAALAECRALRSLGIDPLNYEWVDLYVEWQQLRNHNDRFKFGWVKDGGGEIRESKPHHVYHDCHQETDGSLASCALRLLKLDIDQKHKESMRDIILSKSGVDAQWSDHEKQSVVDYCAADVTVLPKILEKMNLFYRRFFDENRTNIMKLRGRYIAALSRCEHMGTPIDLTTLGAISKNHSKIVSEACESMNSIYPLYQHEKDGAYTFKVLRLKTMLKDAGLLERWPKTNSGLPSTESETIEAFRANPKVEKLHQTRKTISSLKAINDTSKDKLLGRIGSDGNLRSFFGPFGTQTGRNAPKASGFVLAMSNWLRVLIRPPIGKAITGIDYSSQEFAIAASLSEDRNMIAAYVSGDPYLYFAKQAGAVPKDGTKESHKTQRDLFKATTLGLQYGMGRQSLAEKLTHDTGQFVSVEEAQELIELHQRVFPKFWNWADACLRKYKREGALETPDGWVLFGNNPSSLSVKNFLIQATGASILRRSVILATEAGLSVMSPLHDALYIIHDEGNTEAIETLKSCMRRAAQEFVPLEIRMDSTTYPWDRPWVESKGRADYERFEQYLSTA